MKTIQEAVQEILSYDATEINDEIIDNCLEEVDADTYAIDIAAEFESPGYDMWGYAIAYIEDGKPKLVTFRMESC